MFSGFGIEADADTVGKVAMGVTATGITAHAVATNIRKKKLIADLMADDEEEQKSDS